MAGIWSCSEEDVLCLPQQAALLADVPVSGLHLEEPQGREGSGLALAVASSLSFAGLGQ